jgi:hypothetical protein
MYNTLMNSKRKLLVEEQGFASIVIAIVLILVLSLLTVGFADLMRNEEKSATEKHLSSQAYYAAEAGINDAAKAINDGYNQRKTSCGPIAADPTVPGSQWLSNNQVSGSDVLYTCLLIDPVPLSLEYQLNDSSESRAVIVTGVNKDDTTNTTPIGSIYIGWEDKSEDSDFVPAANGHTFKPAADSTDNWTYTNVLRLNLTPLSASVNAPLTRDSLRSNNFAAILFPNDNSAGPANYPYGAGIGFSNSGQILNGNCRPTITTDFPRKCGVVITGLTQSDYLITMQPIYPNKPVHVTIKAKDFDGTVLRIANGQILIDSTGKAQDQLKRVQVRMPAHTGFPHTDYGLESMSSICKLLQLTPSIDTQAPCP